MASNAASSAVSVLSWSTTASIIYHSLSVPELLNLSFVCSATYKSIRDWYSIGYSVNNHLRRFFDEPLSFRLLQAQTGTLISGSNALQFFERRYFPGSDLDLYVPCRHTSTVAYYLFRNEYGFAPTERQRERIPQGTVMDHFVAVSQRVTAHPVNENPDVYPWGQFEDVFNFTHRLHAGRKVQIICVSPGATPLSSILCFHSTLVMNFIAWDMACSFFPAATFLRRTGLLISKPEHTTADHPGMAKYWGRGYKFSPEPAFPVLPSERKLYPMGERWVGDRYSWVISLAGEEIEALPAFSSIDPLEIACQRTPSGFTMGETQIEPPRITETVSTIPCISYRQVQAFFSLQCSYTLPGGGEFKQVSDFVDLRQRFAWNQLDILQTLREKHSADVEDMELDKPPLHKWDEEVIFIIKDILQKRETEKQASSGL